MGVQLKLSTFPLLTALPPRSLRYHLHLLHHPPLVHAHQSLFPLRHSVTHISRSSLRPTCSGEAGKRWFQGTADAVRQFIWVFEDAKNKNVEHILILSGDHLYRMNYLDFIQKHIDTNANITVSCIPMDERTDILLKLLRWSYPSCNDFGSEIIPSAVREHNVQAYLFNDHWEDIGTVKSFFDANLALTEQPPKFEFNDPKTPFYTSPRFLPPTKVEECRIVDAIISYGCFLRECSVQHSIVGVRSCLESGVELKDTMMMDVGFQILTEVLDQKFGRHHGKVVRCMGKAQVREMGASSSRSTTGEVNALKEEVTTLKSQLAAQGEQMSIIVYRPYRCPASKSRCQHLILLHLRPPSHFA